MHRHANLLVSIALQLLSTSSHEDGDHQHQQTSTTTVGSSITSNYETYHRRPRDLGPYLPCLLPKIANTQRDRRCCPHGHYSRNPPLVRSVRVFGCILPRWNRGDKGMWRYPCLCDRWSRRGNTGYRRGMFI